MINEEVTFESSESFKFVMVPITPDDEFEGEESFTAVLSPVPGSSGVEIGQQGTATVTIIDGEQLNSCEFFLVVLLYCRYIDLLLFARVLYS